MATEYEKLEKLEKSRRKPFLAIWRAMHYRILGTSITVGIALIMVMATALAGVFIVYYYQTNTSTETASIYLEEGPNYANAAALGLVSVSGGTTGSPSTEITSGATIVVNGVTGAENTYLLNVFEVVNSSTGVKGPVYLYINGTLPTGVTLYWDNTTEMSFSGTKSGTYLIVQGPTSTGKSINGNGSISGLGSGNYFSSGPIPLTANGKGGENTLYIAFVITGSASGSGTLYLQVSVE